MFSYQPPIRVCYRSLQQKAGFPKTYNPPFSRPESPIPANTQAIPSVEERQTRQYRQDSPSTRSRPLVDGNPTQQSYISLGNPRTLSTLRSTNGSTNTLSFT